MQSTEEFSSFRRIGQLVEKMVEMKKNVSYLLIYLLVTLVLILLVAIVTVKRAFSVINIIKNWLLNQIGELSHIYWERYIQDYWVWRNHAVSKYEKSSRAIE